MQAPNPKTALAAQRAPHRRMRRVAAAVAPRRNPGHRVESRGCSARSRQSHFGGARAGWAGVHTLSRFGVQCKGGTEYITGLAYGRRFETMIRRAVTLVSGLALAVAVETASRPAFAQDIAAAESLFREGKALLDKGDYEAACGKLAESQRLESFERHAPEPRRVPRERGQGRDGVGRVPRGGAPRGDAREDGAHRGGQAQSRGARAAALVSHDPRRGSGRGD